MSKFNVVLGVNEGTLIMNTRSGGILLLNQEYTEKLRGIQESKYVDAEDLVDELRRGGMLIEDDRDEHAELILQSRAVRFSNTSLGLTIAPTMACNFCCPYCYEKGRSTQP